MAGGDDGQCAVISPAPSDEPYAVAVAVHNERMPVDTYRLYFVFVVPRNPKSKIPYLDHLERSYNLEIHEEARKDMRMLLEHLDRTCAGVVKYEFVKLEKDMDVEHVLGEFVDSYQPNMLVVGTHQRTALKKFVLGSVSQFCVDTIRCPVVVIKSDADSEAEGHGNGGKVTGDASTSATAAAGGPARRGSPRSRQSSHRA